MPRRQLSLNAISTIQLRERHDKRQGSVMKTYNAINRVTEQWHFIEGGDWILDESRPNRVLEFKSGISAHCLIFAYLALWLTATARFGRAKYVSRAESTTET